MREIDITYQPYALKDGIIGWQSVKLNKPIATNRVLIDIKSVYRGKYNDTCVSDVRFLYRGRGIPFSNIGRFVKKQQSFSLKMAREAAKSAEAYFRYVYARNSAAFKDPVTGMTYRFDDDRYHVFTEETEGNRGSYRIRGNWLNLEKPYRSYFDHPLKLHYKPAGVNAIIINGNRCRRSE